LKKIREAQQEDMVDIYMMGYDVWGDNLPSEEYVAMCQNSKKYKKAKWYILEETDTKELLSSLIIYDLSPSQDEIVKGVGSIATPLHLRNNGYASLLVKETIEEMELKENSSHFFLYSDIGTDFYKKLGFVVLPKEKQRYKDSVCMYHSKINDVGTILFDIPNYF